MTYAWLAQECGKGPADILGLFSAPLRALKACQDSANEYLGPRSTPPLHWHQLGDAYWSASYHHPADGMHVFTVTRYELDEVLRS